MRQCTRCKVQITGSGQACPLCQSELAGTASEDVFPPIQAASVRKRRLFIRLLAFLSAVAELVCVLVNISLPHTGFWSLFVLAGIGCLWISLSIALIQKRVLLKNIATQAFVLSALSVLWDYFTSWRGWSVNFVVPCIFLVTMLLTPLLALLMRLPARSFIVYFCLVFGFGLIPLIFLLTGLVTVRLPSTLSVGVSAVSLVAMLIFGGSVARQEMLRRFHL